MKQGNDKIRRFLFRQTKAKLESPLLSIWSLESENFLSVCPCLSDLVWTESDGLDYSVFFKLGKIDRWEIIRLSFTPFVLKSPLQARHLFTIGRAYNFLQLSGEDGL